MLTSFDKAAVPFIAAAIAWLDHKYGWKLSDDPATLTMLVGAISTVIVYFIPNKTA
jgi:hypothetical protein